MQSGPAPKPMAVTVYRLTTCPHCHAANGVTAIRCWSCDQPLSDQRWTGEVPDEELAPAREPSLTDADFSFLDDDLLARQKKAAVEDAVATANTFASTLALGQPSTPVLSHRPPVVERVDDASQSGPPSVRPFPAAMPRRPELAPPQRDRLADVESLGPLPFEPLPFAAPSPGRPQQTLRQPVVTGLDWPPAAASAKPMAWPVPQTPEALAYDQPLDFDQPLPFAEPTTSSSEQTPSSDSASVPPGGSTRFSVRGSSIGQPPGAAFGKGRRTEAIVLVLVLGAGLYAYLQSTPAVDEDARMPTAPARPPAIDPETQRLLDLLPPSLAVPAGTPAPAALSAPDEATPSPSAPADSSLVVPAPAPVSAVQQPVAAPAASALRAPATAAVPASVAIPRPAPIAKGATSTEPACAPHVAALGLC